MPLTSSHRFLAPHPRRGGSSREALGRNFVVVRETWRITDDPATARPRQAVLVCGHSAAEAADLGRELAARFARHGFHKASRRWWASDGVEFHRFSVRPARRGLAVLLPLAWPSRGRAKASSGLSWLLSFPARTRAAAGA